LKALSSEETKEEEDKTVPQYIKTRYEKMYPDESHPIRNSG
jgi:hypothetical protein